MCWWVISSHPEVRKGISIKLSVLHISVFYLLPYGGKATVSKKNRNREEEKFGPRFENQAEEKNNIILNDLSLCLHPK